MVTLVDRPKIRGVLVYYDIIPGTIGRICQKVVCTFFMIGAQHMSCLEHRRCPAWNTRNVLLGTQGMSCLEHTECHAREERNVLLRTHGVSCLEHKECLAWNTRNVLLGAQGMSCLAHKETVPEIVQCTVLRKRIK